MKSVSITTILLAVFLLSDPGKLFAETVFFVSNSARANADGKTPGTAFSSLEQARDAVRKLPDSAFADDVVVALLPGTYYRTETFQLTPLDSGRNGQRVIYRAADPKKIPVISGGLVVKQWQNDTINGKKCWKTTLPITDFPDGIRDFYVNNQRRPRARTEAMVADGMVRNEKQEAIGLEFSKDKVLEFKRPKDVQIQSQVSWRHYVVPVQDMNVTQTGAVQLLTDEMDDVEHLSPNFVGFRSSGAIVLDNAIEFLDKPGEWYYQKESGELFYLPFASETLNSVSTVVPRLERLVEVVGESWDKPVRDVTFENIGFCEAAWSSPNRTGWFGYDPGHIIRGDNRRGGVSFANVYATFIENVQFKSNVFARMGGAGLHLHEVNNSSVIGNAFLDMAVEGLAVGTVTGNNNQQVPKNMLIANNVFYRTARSFRMVPAMLTGKLLNGRIVHNHIDTTSYIGINTNKNFGDPVEPFGGNEIRFNYIENVMGPTFDGGAFYTWYKATNQDAAKYPEFRCRVSDNYFKGIFSRDAQGIYLDNDCTDWDVERNVIEDTLGYWYLIKGGNHRLADNFSDTEKFLRMDLLKPDNISEERTTFVKDHDWTKHEIAAKTVKNAGLESEFKGLLRYLPKREKNLPPVIQIEQPKPVSLLKTPKINATIADDRKPYDVIHFQWTKESGPGNVTFYGLQSRVEGITVAFSEPGEYVLKLTANDMRATASKEVRIEVLAADKGRNVVEGIPVSAVTASQVNSPGEAAYHAFDGNPDSYWYPGYPGTGWVQVDLGKAVPIQRIEVVLRNDKDNGHPLSRSEFEILASNDPKFDQFTTLGQQGLDADENIGGIWTANVENPVPLRYIRYWKRLGFDGTVQDIRVYGEQ